MRSASLKSPRFTKLRLDDDCKSQTKTNTTRFLEDPFICMLRMQSASIKIEKRKLPKKDVSDEMKTLMADIDEKFATGYNELPPQETDAYFVENDREALPPSEYMKNKEAGTVPVSAQSIQNAL